MKRCACRGEEKKEGSVFFFLNLELFSGIDGKQVVREVIRYYNIIILFFFLFLI